MKEATARLVQVLIFKILILAALAGIVTTIAADNSVRSIVSLDVYENRGIVDVLLAEREKDEVRLKHKRSSDGGKTWSNEHPLSVPEKMIHPPHRGSDAQIAAYGDRLVAIWTAPGDSLWGSGPIKYATSTDTGVTWIIGGDVADDKSTDGHGYTDIISDSKGNFHAVWLDSRDGGQGLRYATLNREGKSWSKNLTLDGKTCECCWNRIYSFNSDKLYALYRDKEPRDMAIMVSLDSGKNWKRTGNVGSFDWKFNGCPHQGGALLLTKDGGADRIHGFVWTGKEKQQGLYHVSASDDVEEWSKPKRIGDESAMHVDAASDMGARLVAVWDARSGEKRVVFSSHSSDGGKTWSKARRLSSRETSATHPRVVHAGGKFLIFWTETGKSKLKQLSTKEFKF